MTNLTKTLLGATMLISLTSCVNNSSIGDYERFKMPVETKSSSSRGNISSVSSPSYSISNFKPNDLKPSHTRLGILDITSNSQGEVIGFDFHSSYLPKVELMPSKEFDDTFSRKDKHIENRDLSLTDNRLSEDKYDKKDTIGDIVNTLGDFIFFVSKPLKNYAQEASRYSNAPVRFVFGQHAKFEYDGGKFGIVNKILNTGHWGNLESKVWVDLDDRNNSGIYLEWIIPLKGPEKVKRNYPNH